MALASVGLLVGASGPSTLAAEKVDFPQKGRIITVLIPYPPGGSTDVGARLLVPAMEKELGVPVQIVNKPGGGTQLGLAQLALAKPDGYTIGWTNVPSCLPTYLDPKRKATYARKDFQPIANVVVDPAMIVVRADSPFKTTKDLIDAAKANPGTIKAATGGLLTSDHLQTMQFEKLVGVKFVMVHFDGTGPASTALLGGARRWPRRVRRLLGEL